MRPGALTGFEDHHPGKNSLNPQIAKAIKAAMKAENDPLGQAVPVENEFIRTYQRFLPG